MILKTYDRNSRSGGALQKSFKYATEGIGYFFHHERNGKWQGLIACGVFLAGILLSISITEWLAILLFTAMVISLEMFNSALEKLCDHVHPDLHPHIKTIKDMAAGAVLWTSIFAFLAGMFIFLPKIIVRL